jgi:Flp pilus assembly protein TadB
VTAWSEEEVWTLWGREHFSPSSFIRPHFLGRRARSVDISPVELFRHSAAATVVITVVAVVVVVAVTVFVVVVLMQISRRNLVENGGETVTNLKATY